MREGAGWAEPDVRALGLRANGEPAQTWGRVANEHPPVLRTHDRYGHRIDEVEYLEQYHHLMRVAVETGLHAAPWADDRPGAHVARAASMMVWSATDAGHLCPISMTYAAVPALRSTPELAATYEPLLASREYDYGLRPPRTKRALLAGMSMTEKQGGSDVRANTTTAVPDGPDGYRLHRAQVVHLGADVGPVPDPGPGPGRAELLPGAAGAARRHPQPVPPAAAQGQARQQVQRLGRGRVRRRLGPLVGRAGPRGAHHHRDGQHDPAGLRVDGGRRHAAQRRQRRAPRHPPSGVRPRADRPAGHGQRAGRPGRRVRGRHHPGAAPGRGRRPRRPRRRGRDRAPPRRSGRQQVLALQAAGPAHRRGAGVPGRQRLRRGERHASAVPGGAARLDLGGLGQRRRAGHAAGGRAASRRRWPRSSANWSRRPAWTRATTRRWPGCARTSATGTGWSSAPARSPSGWPCSCRAALLLRHGDPAVAEAFVRSRLDGDWGAAYGTLPVGVDTSAILARAALAT